jgi:hypothetical protein
MLYLVPAELTACKRKIGLARIPRAIFHEHVIVPQAILICVPTEKIARKVASRLDFPRRLHSGLFPIWEGYAQGVLVVAVACSGDDHVFEGAVRHLAHFYRLGCALLVEPVVSVNEAIVAGDVVAGVRARHYYCPTALPGNLDCPDDLLFRGDSLREWLAAPDVVANGPLLSRFHSAWEQVPNFVFTPLACAAVGTSPRPLRGWRAHEFVRTRFAVDVVDRGGYGFLAGCAAVGLPALILGCVEGGCSRQRSATLAPKKVEAALAHTALHAAVALAKSFVVCPS